jgi:hypothetical protein
MNSSEGKVRQIHIRHPNFGKSSEEKHPNFGKSSKEKL